MISIVIICPEWSIFLYSLMLNKNMGDENQDSNDEGTSLGRYEKEGYKEITMEKPVEIDATGIERPWRLDPKGYFLIRVNKELGKIEAAFCDLKENKVRKVIRGDSAEEVYTIMLKEDLISMMDHAADMGAQLARVQIALKEGKVYTQDKIDLE